jgi:uncharacterized integral membrane protein
MTEPAQVQPRAARPQQRGTGRLVILAVIAVLLIIFILQNTVSVRLNFLFIDFSMPAWLLVVLTLFIGVIAGLLIGAYARKPHRKQ